MSNATDLYTRNRIKTQFMALNQSDKSPLASTGAKGAAEVQPSVAAVVLNWNGREQVLETISALYKSEYPLQAIFMVDNGSTDHSIETVQKKLPTVKILPQETNLGVSEGRNVGIREAVASGIDY